MSGGPLDQEYEIKEIIFHWGNTNFHGSEHLLDGKRFESVKCLLTAHLNIFSFPLEMQVVHMNGDDTGKNSNKDFLIIPKGLCFLHFIYICILEIIYLNFS